MRSPRKGPCIVVWDDERGVCCPMGPDTDCEGAICSGDQVSLFPSPAAARRAIGISRRWAELQRAQGKPYISDFIEGKFAIKILPVVLEPEPEPEPEKDTER